MLVSMLLYILGVPLWMLLGALVLALLNRRRAKNYPGSFAAKFRPESNAGVDEAEKWPRMSSRCLWTHDVLLTRSGLGMMRVKPYGVAAVDMSVQDARPEDVKGLGENPRFFDLCLDDGSVFQMAVPGEARELARGPFSIGEAEQVEAA